VFVYFASLINLILFFLNIIKLSATQSTNSYLKELSKSQVLKDTTVVITESQTKGRGQQHTHWQSTRGKSLTFSVYKTFEQLPADRAFVISMQTALAITRTLKYYSIPNVTIKWPNDIMADGKKCCGILIENSVKGSSIASTIIGVGLNVNEISFESLPSATSLLLSGGRKFELQEVFQNLVSEIEIHLNEMVSLDVEAIFNNYTSHLYRKNSISVFEDTQGNRFNGAIKGVSKEGLLMVFKEDDQIHLFNLKEIKLIQ
jgi:BirA family biotin operon repressor/biotin-[acetyl-CoA-carboxylase] ligase